ncbi:unnamed protein product [Caenorhabditis nigoni]
MRVIFLLLLLILIVESSPTVSGRELDSILDKCFRLIPTNMWKVVPKEEFEARKPKIQEHLNCLEGPTCEVVRSTLKIQKAKIEIMERASEIHSCLGNGTFKNLKNECISVKGCSEESICVVQKIRKEKKCNEDDVEKFKEIAKIEENVCELIIIHNEKALEAEKRINPFLKV